MSVDPDGTKAGATRISALTLATIGARFAVGGLCAGFDRTGV